MIIAPTALSQHKLSRAELAPDKKAARRFGPCSLGKKALYMGGFYFNNTHYIPLKNVERVYKRLAVSKGFYEGKTYGTLCYLVAVYDGGKERKCRFQHEQQLDDILSAIRRGTKIPVGKA